MLNQLLKTITIVPYKVQILTDFILYKLIYLILILKKLV